MMYAERIRTYKKYIPTFVWQAARCFWLAANRTMNAVTPYIRTRMYAGFVLYYSRGNAIIDRLVAEPIFEEKMSTKIVVDLREKPGSVFVDVGANIGLIIANVLKEIATAQVTAFEPGPKQADLLAKTIMANNWGTQVSLETVALSDREGVQTFYTHLSRDFAKDGLQDTGRGEKTKAIEVQTVTLDTWWKLHGKPKVGVVKIDTEGAELLILRGAKEFIEAEKPIFYLEIEPTNLRAYPYGVTDVVQFIASIHYTIETLDGVQVDMTNIDKVLETEDTFRVVPT